MEIVAFVVAIPVAIELIAALYGPIDVASSPRRLPLALVRLAATAAIAAGFALWLGRAFVAGLAFMGAAFVLKHWFFALSYRLPAEYKVAVWTGERAKKIPGDK